MECTVWRGGMIAGIASLLGKGRDYYLFDSFEGLTDVQEIDGKSAARWQSNKTFHDYFDNCRAEISFATEVMRKRLVIMKGCI
ncbi:MAG: hypothetical protein ABI472_12230 [Ginsengibacter sp.]